MLEAIETNDEQVIVILLNHVELCNYIYRSTLHSQWTIAGMR